MIVLWIICRATRLALAVFRQAMKIRRGSVMPSRLRGVTVRWPAKAAWAAFGIEIVILAASASILLVRGRDLKDRDVCLLHEAQEPCTVASVDSTPMRCSSPKGEHPGEHLAIALTGGGEGSCSDHLILLIGDRCDVQILVRYRRRLLAAVGFGFHRHGPSARMARDQDDHETRLAPALSAW